MTAIVLPDLDRSTIEDLKSRMPSLRLADIELPSMERAGRQADEAIDRLLGRSRSTPWPWLAAAIGLAAIIGSVAAVLTWGRRPGSTPGAGSGLPGATDSTRPADPTGAGIEVTTAFGETSIDTQPELGVGATPFGIDAAFSPYQEPQP